MDCANEQICETKSSIIKQEIDNSFQYILNQKQIALTSIKLYLTVLCGLFAYSAFLQTKILNNKIQIPDSNYMIYAIFGIVITLITFVIGWALLDFLTHIIFSTVLHYKHISFMRAIASKIFTNNTFIDNCVLPIKSNKISLIRQRHLPIIFSLINLSLLFFNYYFFKLFLTDYLSITICMSIIAIFSLYYPNVCAKYNEEILIAQRTTPQKDENHNREVIKKTIKKNKSRRDNKLFWYFLILFFLLFVILIGYNVYTITNKNAISNWFILTELGLLLLIASIRYLIAQYRVEEFKLSIRKVET